VAKAIGHPDPSGKRAQGPVIPKEFVNDLLLVDQTLSEERSQSFIEKRRRDKNNTMVTFTFQVR
jgi:hypothetical protein